jgi:hypothetical protein
MTDLSQQLSDLESLAYAIDYDMVEYDQAKIDELAAAVIAMEKTALRVFGATYSDVAAIINNARNIADTSADDWSASMR